MLGRVGVGGGVERGGAVLLLDLDVPPGDHEAELGVRPGRDGRLADEVHHLVLELKEVDGDGLVAEDDGAALALEDHAVDGDLGGEEVAGGVGEEDAEGAVPAVGAEAVATGEPDPEEEREGEEGEES